MALPLKSYCLLKLEKNQCQNIQFWLEKKHRKANIIKADNVSFNLASKKYCSDKIFKMASFYQLDLQDGLHLLILVPVTNSGFVGIAWASLKLLCRVLHVIFW